MSCCLSGLSGYGRDSRVAVRTQYLPLLRSLDLQVSLDGHTFAIGQFPPSLRPEQHVSSLESPYFPWHLNDYPLHEKAYTILESSTDSVFLHMTTSEPPRPYWGDLLKSNWNGTYFGSSIPNVNRDPRGYVDFEKMIGLDGVAIINIVSNPQAAAVTGTKELQTRIT